MTPPLPRSCPRLAPVDDAIATNQHRTQASGTLGTSAWLALAIATLSGCASLDGTGFSPLQPPPQVTTVPTRNPADGRADAAAPAGTTTQATPAAVPNAKDTKDTKDATGASGVASTAAPGTPVPVQEGPLAPVPGITAPAAPAAVPAANAASESGIDVAGPPSDPLEPEAPVQLDPATTHADLWARIRRGFGMPPLDSDLVREHERWYASRPDYVQRMTERGSRYLFHIVAEVERRKMPLELALLPFIESAFNPTAISTARASGMWQFMPGTGRDYDLKQNLFRDDRRDVLASTRAALDYLGRLHGMFGDWQLALAAYNWGEGNVKKALARNEKAGLPTDYASLSMPAETRHYVPKLLAVKHIVADPKGFGLSLPEVQNHPYFLSVPIQRDIDVALAARLAGLSVDEFRNLNPQHSKPVILAAGTPQVLLPFDNADRFVQQLKQHRGQFASWTAWVVPKTMRPAEAARQTGMSEATLREVNRIPSRMLVKAGSALLVPRSERRVADVPEALADNGQMTLAPDLPPMRKVSLKARKGDTVASLARRYRVSAAQFAQWNQMGTSSALKAGQTLVVYQPNKVKSKARAGAAPQRRVARPTSAATPRAGSVAKRNRGNVKVARRADD